MTLRGIFSAWFQESSVVRKTVGVFPRVVIIPLRVHVLICIYIGLKVVPYIGTLGPKYILFGYMDP